MKIAYQVILKLILSIGIILFAMVNYRVLSFDKGWSIVSINNDSSFNALKLVNYIPEKIEYFKRAIPNSKYDYKIYIVTKEHNYLFDATKEQIDTLDVLGIFANNIKPEKAIVIPFYVDIIVGLIVICVPFGRPRKKQNVEESPK